MLSLTDKIVYFLENIPPRTVIIKTRGTTTLYSDVIFFCNAQGMTNTIVYQTSFKCLYIFVISEINQSVVEDDGQRCEMSFINTLGTFSTQHTYIYCVLILKLAK